MTWCLAKKAKKEGENNDAVFIQVDEKGACR